MEKFNIEGKEIEFYGTSNGSNSNKFNRVNKIARDYDLIKSRLDRIVERERNNETTNSKDFSMAVCMFLMMRTGIRIGNEDSAEGYMTVPRPNSDEEPRFVKTYGLTTLLREHISISRKGRVNFDFIGKKQVDNTFELDAELSKMVIEVAAHRHEPFFGINDGELTRFVKRIAGDEFTPKDFRTFKANIYAYQELKRQIRNIDKPKSLEVKEKKEIVNAVGDFVCNKLNNTRAVVLTSYINPQIWEYNLNHKR